MIRLSFKLMDDTTSNIIALELHDDGGQACQVKTPLRIAKEKWDPLLQRPRNIYLKDCKRLNERLDRLRIAVTDYLDTIYWKFERISLRALGNRVRKNAAVRTTEYPKESLLWYMKNYITSRSHLICSSTRKRYFVFFNLFQRFEGYSMRHLMISDVNAAFVKQFLEFGKQEAYSSSTMHRSVNFIKTVLNYLERRGTRTFVYELELPKESRNKSFITLSEDELMKIKRMDVSPSLQAARDWLVISCYTGQRVSDFMTFNSGMLQHVDGQECIGFIQKKTQRNVLLPLHPAVQVIRSQNEENFPAKLSTKKYNEQIKEVVRLAGIDSLVSIGKRTGYRVVVQQIPKWQAVTSHIGRRSFASNFYSKIPTSLLMEATGHSSEQMFHRYINHIDKERIRSLRLYFEQTYKSKFET
jgi:integrase